MLTRNNKHQHRFFYTLRIVLLWLITVTQSYTYASSVNLTEQDERDLIFGLLAYSIVYKDWQPKGTANKRGHNIGSVLVDPKGNPVFWARNANSITNNSSQHGEVRAVANYLSCSKDVKYLRGYTIYTTLEPCAMCTGMLILTNIDRVVFGQEDPGFGNALERLASTPDHDPYPRLFKSVPLNQSETKRLLDKSYRQASGSITSFLQSTKAKNLYRKASEQLQSLKLVHDSNKKLLASARKFLSKVSSNYVDDLSKICPSS